MDDPHAVESRQVDLRYPGAASNIQVRDLQGIRLDEVPARLDDVTHQGREHLLRVILVIDTDLQQRTRVPTFGRNKNMVEMRKRI